MSNRWFKFALFLISAPFICGVISSSVPNLPGILLGGIMLGVANILAVYGLFGAFFLKENQASKFKFYLLFAISGLVGLLFTKLILSLLGLDYLELLMRKSDPVHFESILSGDAFSMGGTLSSAIPLVPLILFQSLISYMIFWLTINRFKVLDDRAQVHFSRVIVAGFSSLCFGLLYYSYSVAMMVKVVTRIL